MGDGSANVRTKVEKAGYTRLKALLAAASVAVVVGAERVESLEAMQRSTIVAPQSFAAHGTMLRRAVGFACRWSGGCSNTGTRQLCKWRRLGRDVTPAASFGVSLCADRMSSWALSSTTTETSSAAADTASSANVQDAKATSDFVMAEGDVVSFVASSAGGGVAAVALRESDGGGVAATTQVDGLSLDHMPAARKVSSAMQGDDLTGRRVSFDNGSTGVVLTQRPPLVFVLVDHAQEAPGGPVDASAQVLSSWASVSVSSQIVGSAIDWLGRPLAPNGDTSAAAAPLSQPRVFAPIPQVKDIALIDAPLLTGTSMVDALTPIGRGQNMLFVGQDDVQARRDLLLNTIRTHVAHSQGAPLRFVYAMTSPSAQARQEVMEKLAEAQLLDHVVVVSARGDNAPADAAAAGAAEAVAVAAAACAVAESLAGVVAGPHDDSPTLDASDVVVIVDTLDWHKELWDWTTRVLVDTYGMQAVVSSDRDGSASSSEKRAFFSSLIQRSARYKERLGGKSVTLALLATLPQQTEDAEERVFTLDDFAAATDRVKARIEILAKSKVPLTAANLRRIQIPVPEASDSEYQRQLALQHVDDLISMSDGQVWFDETLGQQPPIDPQRSITRVGVGADTDSRADAPALRTIVGGLRFEFQQTASLEGAGEGSGADRQLRRREAWLLAMHPPPLPRTLSQNCVALLAAAEGSLDEAVAHGAVAGTREGTQLVESLLAFVQASCPAVLRSIDRTLDMTPSERQELVDAIGSFFSS